MREQTEQRVVAVARLSFGGLTAAALGAQAWHVAAQGKTLVNFFSYFTIESNIVMTVVLLAGGVLGLTGRRGGVPDLLRGAATLYMAITGVVYAVALAQYEALGTLAWVDDVVHRIMPVVIFLDWVLVPPVRRLRYSEALRWLVFPLVFLAYTLIRGPFAGWYPYPFLDPRDNGYAHVAVSSVLITLAFLAFGAALVRIGNVLGGRRRRSRATVAEPVETLTPPV
ncbi:Pr6Pr family membrane protein [Streptacidiphilus fuscans]|uniref:Pr6Pr family membrane protein n=1 Tax=Streptacidiphilus fuscans TaxID=2789292 RepID=A0A931B9V1_9ACTN|nr:Pr6Pr family membrane protein [Streptacidiphilus fuscans]MBF9071686.1 Pr6Pr family membrane protein [Streptacidiphilus fuscans]